MVNNWLSSVPNWASTSMDVCHSSSATPRLMVTSLILNMLPKLCHPLLAESPRPASVVPPPQPEQVAIGQRHLEALPPNRATLTERPGPRQVAGRATDKNVRVSPRQRVSRCHSGRSSSSSKVGKSSALGVESFSRFTEEEIGDPGVTEDEAVIHYFKRLLEGTGWDVSCSDTPGPNDQIATWLLAPGSD